MKVKLLFTGEGPRLHFVEAHNDQDQAIKIGEWSFEGPYQVLTIDAEVSCQCAACLKDGPHQSDCAVHNPPVYPPGDCTCSKEHEEGERFCCVFGCPYRADFAIFGESNHPDDATDACQYHVGTLCGTPDWLSKDNRHWTVMLIDHERNYPLT